MLAGESCTPVIEKLFNVAKISIGAKARLTVRVRNNNATLGLTGVAFVDTYPTGMTNPPVPNISTSCTASVTAVAGTNSLQVVNAAIGAAAYCDISVDVITSQAGNLINRINAGALVGTLIDQTVYSLFEATAPLETVQPLTAVKTVTTLSDPHNVANPKAVPGALLQYAITVANPSTSTVSAVVLGDAIPANSKLVVADIGVAGGGPALFTQPTTTDCHRRSNEFDKVQAGSP